MSDDSTPPSGSGDPPAPGGRRQSDRRTGQRPFDGPDRRKGDRRSGTDRRAAPRTSGDTEAE